MSGVLVLAEHRDDRVSESTRELITLACELGSQGAGDVTVCVVGAEAEHLAASCGAGGISQVVAVTVGTREFEPHVMQTAVEELLADLDPEIVLAVHSVDAFGFVPALAARNRLGFASNVLSAERVDGFLRARRGVYGDRLVAEVLLERSPGVLMVRPGAYAAASEESSAIVLRHSGAAPSSRHLGYRESKTDGIDITGSEFLLSIGRGIGEEENVKRFSDLADRLGATLSASRPLVDAGWLPSSRQVGQSGQTVKPKVYLSLGISGAAQHLAGIRDAETVIAVNTDPDAPIFGVARYGAVVDLFELADALENRD